MRKPCSRSQASISNWRLELEPLARADAVDPDRERAVGRDRRVLLPQRAGCGVARVRRELLPRSGEPLVQRAEARDRQVHLATHLEQRRQPVSEHPQRHRADRAQVHGHVLALDAVAARGAADEDAVLVGEVDREPVDLRLEHVRDGLVGAEALPDVVRPLLERLGRRHLLERAHRRRVGDLLEALRRRRADPLGRRVRRDELGMIPLERRPARRRARRRPRRGSRGRRGRGSGASGRRRARAARSTRVAAIRQAPRISSGCWTRASGSSREEPLVGMDAAPADRDRRGAGSLARPDVERRVADVHRLLGSCVEAAQRLEHRVGVGLVALRVVSADEHVGQLAEKREPLEGELDGGDALRGHDPEQVAAAAELDQQLQDAVEGLERGVQRLVVGAVDVDELVDAVGVELVHLRDQAGPADRGAHELLVRLAPEHGHGRMPHRGDDDRPRVDQGAVEIEEDDADTACADRIRAARGDGFSRSPGFRPRTRRAPGTAPTAAPWRRPRSAAGPRAAPRSAPAAPAASCRRAFAPCGGGTSRP